MAKAAAAAGGFGIKGQENRKARGMAWVSAQQ